MKITHAILIAILAVALPIFALAFDNSLPDGCNYWSDYDTQGIVFVPMRFSVHD